MARIKICGLTRKEDIDAVNSALPDYIGLVFAKSRRQVSEEQAKVLKAHLNPSIEAVGVFVNDDVDRIIRLCRTGVIDLIQLHGDEDEIYIQALKSSVPNRIIKAVRVRETDDIKKAMALSCDYLLMDAWHEGQYGGMGKTFDWSLIPEISKPFFLAGGIHTGNIQQAVEAYHPYAIDVSSGVETDGFKDPVKITEIVALTRKIESRPD